jgi:hypothetical protein
MPADPLAARPITRRSFLLAGGAGVALALATGLEPAAAAGNAKKLTPLVLASDVYASPQPQRFVFALAKGPKFASGAPAKIAFAPPEGNQGTVLDTALYTDGLPRGRGIYVTETVFPVSGYWKAVILSEGKRVPFSVQVKAQAEAPVVGAAAPTVPSPTPTVPLGVKPICTREPPCPLHAVSLADVIGQGRPVAAMFATPALCQSQYCGPVLDELLDVMAPYQDRVTFVHVEIYDSTRGAQRSPTVEAWGLPSEPWLFAIDGAGTILTRLDGAIAKDEIVPALQRLVT